MRFEDDFDELPRRLRIAGVSPAWRIVAILGMIGTGIFLVLAFALMIALVVRNEKQTAVQTQVQNWGPVAVNPQGMMQPGPDGEDDQEPANPPYPLTADLQPRGTQRAPEEPKGGQKPGARDRFLQLGQELWSTPAGHAPRDPSISPDGKHIAYVNQKALMVGAVGGAMEQVIPGGGMFQPRAFPRNGQGAIGAIRDGTAVEAIGNLTWSEFGRHLFFATADGSLNRYELSTRRLEVLPFHGDSPLPLPLEPGKLIFRRSHAARKLDLPGRVANLDPAEIVLGDIETHQVRVLIPESEDYWGPLAVSPDGKRLVLVSNHGLKKQPERYRLFLFDLAEGNQAEPKPIGRPSRHVTGVGWEPDSSAFVCARSQEPLPPDAWDADGLGSWVGIDLFRYEVKGERETRLSRGGGFDAPVTPAADELLFLAWRSEAAPVGWRMYRTKLADVQKFAEQEADSPRRDGAAWTQLLELVLKETDISANVSGEQLTSEKLSRVAETFAKLYRDRFKIEPPNDAAGWERMQRELGTLDLSAAVRTQAALVLGACEGEYLLRRYNAAWLLTAGPLIRTRARPDKPDEESPFGFVLNPFAASRIRSASPGTLDGEDNPVSSGGLVELLRQAQGRKIVLANDAAEGRKAVEPLTDHDWVHGIELLHQNKAEKGEQLLLDLVGLKPLANNRFLAVRVGEELAKHKRWEALRQLMEPRVRQQPADAAKHRLLGLALLDADPKAAVAQFKTALRFNLYDGGSYFNLAQAYENMGDRESARLCLKRYLKLMPYGPLVQDARHRMAALAADNPLQPRAGVRGPAGRALNPR
jgi:Tol biopolymer transport system component